ncbi:hypothetical protein NM688_g5664 [Phlebia brevispora]|uniref:Uncharacterized protein n=1 Tax=Phlebia brevispora TaxID=194682 RepID=A0ACC1SS10_9APHY|nr:hypothetical protein NM688_g5664 [Phlebia brevispora]
MTTVKRVDPEAQGTFLALAGHILRQGDSSAVRASNCRGPGKPSEAVKREHVTQTKAMWEKRLALVDEDKKLFQVRERVPKRIETGILKTSDETEGPTSHVAEHGGPGTRKAEVARPRLEGSRHQPLSTFSRALPRPSLQFYLAVSIIISVIYVPSLQPNEMGLQHLSKDTSIPLPATDAVPRNFQLPGDASSQRTFTNGDSQNSAHEPPQRFRNVRLILWEQPQSVTDQDDTAAYSCPTSPHLLTIQRYHSPSQDTCRTCPPQASPLRNASPTINGNTHDAVNGATPNGDQDVKMGNITIHASPPSQTDGVHQTDGNQTTPISSPMRPKSQPPSMTGHSERPHYPLRL